MHEPIRRTPVRRKSAQKRIELTKRDLAVFRLLSEYRYLTTPYLHAFVGGASVKRFTERLGHLFHEGYIDRPAEQWLFADARHRPATYELRTRTRVALREAGLGACPRTYLSGAHRQFQHSRLICEALASIELGVAGMPGTRFVPWGEILTKASGLASSAMPFRIPTPAGSAVIPDAFFGIEYTQGGTKSYRFFALEVDRGTMPIARTDARQSSYLGKLAAYQAVLGAGAHTSHLAVPNLFVLTFTESGKRLDNIQNCFAPGPYSAVFLFRSFDVLSLRTPCTALAAEPWARIGHSPLTIGVP